MSVKKFKTKEGIRTLLLTGKNGSKCKMYDRTQFLGLWINLFCKIASKQINLKRKIFKVFSSAKINVF